MQGERAGNLPGVWIGLEEQRFFLVKFILNLANKFLEDIFECDHAESATIFIYDDGHVQFAIEKQLQQAFKRMAYKSLMCTTPTVLSRSPFSQSGKRE